MSGISVLSRSHSGSAGGWSDVAGNGGLHAPSLIELLKDASDSVDSDPGAARSCLKRVLAQLESVCLSTEVAPLPAVKRGGLAPWQENRVKSYIEANLEQSIRVAELAALSRLSERYFAVAFKQNIGLTTNAFILLRRVERAQNLMSSTKRPLADIALACGFSDQAHFCRRFRRITGCTPKAWRREHGDPTVSVPARFTDDKTRFAAAAGVVLG